MLTIASPQTSRRTLKRSILQVVATAALLPVIGCESATDPDNTAPVVTEPLVVEFDGAFDFTDGTAVGAELGRTELQRDESGLTASVHADGLIPGGVFTFWWVVVQGAGTIPDDVFVALGGSAVVGQDGIATVQMTAATGTPGVVGFPPLQGALFNDLVDPLNATVRVEVAYHGQAEDAGTDLNQWLGDFWTGTACPSDGLNAAGQPHCPVYFASTHAPPVS